MKTIIYTSILFIVFYILYNVLDEKKSEKPKKKCKTLHIRIKSPESIRTDYISYSNFVDQYKPEKIMAKKHDIKKDDNEWLNQF
tara:strand:- start:2486 stop:2737 length:252 start_codon:yes stop_codon:yes gene_type:complete